MKKFTILTMLIALFSVTAFAQKGIRQQFKAFQQTHVLKAVDRKAQPVAQTRRAASDELVTLPEGAEVETWYTTGGSFYLYSNGWQDLTSDMPTVNVAIVGDTMYVQGLAYWFKDGWMKGTIEGNTVTFPSGQLIGEDSYGPEYIAGSDDGSTLSENIEFSYDAENGILTAVTPYVFENGATDKVSAYTFWYQAVFSKSEPAAPEVVVLPEGAVAEDFVMSYTDSDDAAASTPVKVAVVDNNVYVQGISNYLPEAWVVGTKEGNAITFPAMQYMGEYYTYGSSYAFYNGEAVFTYDAEAGTYTAEGEIYGVLADQYYDGHYFNPILKKITEKAGVPATPAISEVGDTQYGPAMTFNIPLEDVEGNTLVPSKLSYLVFSDVEGVVDTVTFSPDYYEKLTEEMTVIPYGFTEDYDFYAGMIYLNMPEYVYWNRIGIQSIYTGGGEVNKSEIGWYEIQPYSHAIFNFNAMDVATSNNGNEGDITEDTTFVESGVELTVSPSTASTPNRFWSTANGPQLRVYGGQLTFAVEPGRVITGIAFVHNGKWGANTVDGEAIPNDEETKVATWTGEAQTVVVTIAGNTQLNSIVVETAEFVPTPVEVPENLVTEPYLFEATAVEAPYDDEEEEEPYAYAEQVQVGFDGDDLYIQGLNLDDDSMWAKATKNADGKYEIPAGQYLGTIDYFGIWTYDYYLLAVDTVSYNWVPAVFTFDAEAKKLTLEPGTVLVLNESATENAPYITFYDVTMTKINEVAATPVDPTVDAVNISAYGYPYADFVVPTFGTNDEVLLTDKLFYSVYVEKDGVQQLYTFDAVSYAKDFDTDVTEIPYNHDGYDFYKGGNRVYFEVEADEFKTWSKVGVQSIYYGAGEVHKSNIVWADNSAYDPEVGVSSINAKVGKQVIYNLAGQRLSKMQKGINIINGKKVMVK
ncbi:MAG: hypothetical protein J5671_06050 [Bacteroidaceae bacterium]|nr:hypothetical protein [Bacteroidaceae bacterium]